MLSVAANNTLLDLHNSPDHTKALVLNIRHFRPSGVKVKSLTELNVRRSLTKTCVNQASPNVS